MRNSLASARRVTAILLLALWWGGFSFYAGRVVFIGHEILKSKLRQGFITERVTTELNWIGLAALVFVGWELLARGKFSKQRALCIAWLIATITTVVLFSLHSKLAAMLDFSIRQVADDEHFYGWHRAYLLTATVQWLAGATLLVLFYLSTCPTKPSNNLTAG